MKNSTRHKITPPPRHCSLCGKKEGKEGLSSLRITLHDARHRYKGSNRPFISVWSLKLCKKCMKERGKILGQLVD